MSNRERTIESKGRIEFIDLAKGICILLVVMIHVGVPEYIPGLYAAKVPIFFLLSGLFFLKKVNFFLRGGYWNKLCTTIVIPFLAYYLISYAMFYVIDRVNRTCWVENKIFLSSTCSDSVIFLMVLYGS